LHPKINKRGMACARDQGNGSNQPGVPCGEGLIKSVTAGIMNLLTIENQCANILSSKQTGVFFSAALIQLEEGAFSEGLIE
jgi:hypothetical protein